MLISSSPFRRFQSATLVVIFGKASGELRNGEGPDVRAVLRPCEGSTSSASAGLLVVRELLLGPKRFTDLLDGLPGISTNVLATRLRQLERAGVLARAQLPPPAASSVYELTPYGRGLEGPVAALGRWGAASLGARQGGQVFRSHWLALALKAFFHRDAAAGISRVYEVRLREGVFRLAVADGALEVEPGAAGGADLVLEADDDTLVGVLAGQLDPAALTVVEGDPSELGRFVEIFRFAEPQPAASR